MSHVLNTPKLYALWQQQVEEMRLRMQQMRQSLRDQLEQALEHDFSYLTTQQGMFSYTGLSPAQVQQLRDDYAIYLVGSGRLCIAGLNQKNLSYVAQSLSQVLTTSSSISA